MKNLSLIGVMTLYGIGLGIVLLVLDSLKIDNTYAYPICVFCGWLLSTIYKEK